MPSLVRRPTRRRVARLLLLSSVAACGGGGGGSSDPDYGNPGPTAPNAPQAPAAPVNAASVGMRSTSDGYSDEHRFTPESVTLRRNGTVTWSNETGVAHNVTFAGGAGAPASIGSHTAGSNVRTFGTAGTFTYSCTNHAGMSGTIAVVD